MEERELRELVVDAIGNRLHQVKDGSFQEHSNNAAAAASKLLSALAAYSEAEANRIRLLRFELSASELPTQSGESE